MSWDSLGFVMRAVEINKARRHAEFVETANAAAACASASIGKQFGRRVVRLTHDVATFAKDTTPILKSATTSSGLFKRIKN